MVRRRGTLLITGALAGLALPALPTLAGDVQVLRPPDNGRSPAVNYMTQCQGCHLPDGSGRLGQVPSFKGQLRHFLASEEGRSFLVQVPGSANARLSDADLAAVLNWMVATMSPAGAGRFVPYQAGEVGRYRMVKLDSIPARRAAIVAKFPRVAR